MRDIERIDPIIERLRAIWKTHPDLRLGQLISNVIQDPQIYFAEDEQLIEVLEKYYYEFL